MSRLKLFILFFCYSLIVATVFQKFLVPKLNPTATLGLFGDDALHFHSEAIKLAAKIHLHGWSAWQLFPSPSSSINVSLLGILYFLFGHNPALMLPINTIIHAASGIIVFQIAYELSRSKKAGIYAGLICSLLFVLSPSSLNWYGQLHKDGWLIIGMLLIILSFVKILTQKSETKQSQMERFFRNLFLYIVGLTFISISRPYAAKLLVLILIIYLLLFLIAKIKNRQNVLLISSFFLTTAIVGFLSILIIKNYFPMSNQGNSYDSYTVNNWEWKKSTWIPEALDKEIEKLARTRLGFINYANAVGAKSNIDLEIMPDNARDVIIYSPRAIEIAVLAPFPVEWFKELNALKLVSILEMSVTYFCILGIVFLYSFPEKKLYFFITFFSLSFLYVNGVTCPNIGTLYRARFVYEFLLIIIGVVGWVDWIINRIKNREFGMSQR